jgi:GAF domain-containing protein
LSTTRCQTRPAVILGEDTSMAVNEREFFREATLHICGDLDIEKAMVGFLHYLRKFMPADRLVLERFDEERGSARIVAHATPEGGTAGDVLAPLSDEAKRHIKWMYRRGVPEPYYENDPAEHPPARELLSFHRQEASAFLELPLLTRDGRPGAVVLLAERGRYDDSHLRLMSLLRAPFQVALTNALQHAEIVRLKDTLAADNKALLAHHTRTYLSLRKAVGLIGILMPFTLMLGNFLIFRGEIVLRSISRYYHSDMRNVFVAALCAMALFLFFYSGYDWRERWAAIFAGVLTLGVAFFPTTLAGPPDLTGRLHYTCAVLLFLLLAWISLFHFPRKPPGVAKQVTDKIQVICGLLMIVCVVSIILYYAFIRTDGVETSFVFVAETVALIAFGVSWFTEGLDLERVIS